MKRVLSFSHGLCCVRACVYLESPHPNDTGNIQNWVWLWMISLGGAKRETKLTEHLVLPLPLFQIPGLSFLTGACQIVQFQPGPGALSQILAPRQTPERHRGQAVTISFTKVCR